MSILKLTEAGEEMTLALKTAEIVQGNFGQQAKFIDVNGDVLFVPLSSVERQLDRCGVATVEELAGRKIHFSRAASNKPGGKPFWNMDKARDGDVVHTNGKPAPAYQDGPLPGEEAEYADHLASQSGAQDDFALLVRRYQDCVRAATESWGDDMTSESLVAAAATLFIERNRRNI